eukprot:771139_1
MKGHSKVKPQQALLTSQVWDHRNQKLTNFNSELSKWEQARSSQIAVRNVKKRKNDKKKQKPSADGEFRSPYAKYKVVLPGAEQNKRGYVEPIEEFGCPPCLIWYLKNNELSRLEHQDLQGRIMPPSVIMRHLMVLDLSFNWLEDLPSEQFWKCCPNLEILYLDNNDIHDILPLQNLHCLTKLAILTLHDNPVASHKSYRHLAVNVLLNLK